MNYNIDVIGLIFEPTGNMISDGEGGEYPEQAPIVGWHVNTSEPVEAWEQYRVTPTAPRRVYTGLEPVCYAFPDEATYLTAKEALDAQV